MRVSGKSIERKNTQKFCTNPLGRLVYLFVLNRLHCKYKVKLGI